jgi:uncharacterized membrane protein YfcA
MSEQRSATAPVWLAVVACVWLPWLVAVVWGDRLATVCANLPMAATMVVGSLVAGATSEGGGAVAFPVLTLLFEASPSAARDFALLIQSVGMTAAAVVIVQTRTPIATRAVVLAGLGGIPGIVLGIQWISVLLPPPITKLVFVSVWLSFGLMLGLSLRDEAAVRHLDLRGGRSVLVLVCGFLGGILTGICGSGIDIATFSALTLGFHLDERVATPSSVVLMASNALVGLAWRLVSAPIPEQVWGWWWAAVPVVVVGAPAGARLIVRCSRRFIVRLLQLSISIQFVGALVLIPLDAERVLAVLVALTSGTLFFGSMHLLGNRATLAIPGEQRA